MNHEEWADGNPFTHFQKLFAEAAKSEAFDPTRAALATVDAGGQPSVRFVLVRGMYDDSFVFYTDYRSKKSRHLDENPLAALTWHWSTTGFKFVLKEKRKELRSSIRRIFCESSSRQSTGCLVLVSKPGAVFSL